MKKWLSLFTLILASLMGVLWYIRETKISDKNIQLNYLDMKPVLALLSEEWLSPSWSMEKVEQNCPSLFQEMKGVGSELLRCNPLYLKCRFQNEKLNSLKLEFNDFQNLGFTPVSKLKSSRSLLPHQGMSVDLILGDKKQKVYLENECHKVYLPQRRYRYMHSDENEKWYWDNFNRRVYIDRYMVSNFWVKVWKATLGQSYGYDENLFSPATNLTLEEMKKFCFSRGGHLLQAHYYDAAAMFPKNTEDPRPESITLSYFPWTTKNKTEPLFLWQENKLKTAPKNICDRLRSSDCQQHQVYVAGNKFETWAGLGDILNGYSEVVDNPIEPNRNLSFFDYSQSSKSKYLRLGVRVEWDGKDFGKDHFKIENIDEFDIQKIKVGFRCMYYDFGFKK